MQLQSREMTAVIADRIRKRVATTRTDNLVLACIAYIKRHDAAVFATVMILNLTIMKLLEISGPVRCGVMRKALLGPEEGGSKIALEPIAVRNQYGDAYVSFHTGYRELEQALAAIPTSTSIPVKSKARLETLAKRFPQGSLEPLFKAVDPGYYLKSESIQSYNDSITEYLYFPETAAKKENLKIEDLNYCRILPELVKLGDEMQGQAEYDLSEARGVAASLMKWVVLASLDMEKPSSNRGRKQLFKETLRTQREELEQKFGRSVVYV